MFFAKLKPVVCLCLLLFVLSCTGCVSGEPKDDAPAAPVAVRHPDVYPDPTNERLPLWAQPSETEIYWLENINLDGDGDHDDAACVSVYQWGPSVENGSLTVLRVLLGCGISTSFLLPGTAMVCKLESAPIFSTEWDALVLETFFPSTDGAPYSLYLFQVEPAYRDSYLLLSMKQFLPQGDADECAPLKLAAESQIVEMEGQALKGLSLLLPSSGNPNDTVPIEARWDVENESWIVTTDTATWEYKSAECFPNQAKYYLLGPHDDAQSTWPHADIFGVELLENVNIDGVGNCDDSVCTSTYEWTGHLESRLLTVIQVHLGTGETLVYFIRKPSDPFLFDVAPIFSETRNAVVAEYMYPYANSGAATIYVLDIHNGGSGKSWMRERYNSGEAVNGSLPESPEIGTEIIDIAGSGQKGIRIPEFDRDKWEEVWTIVFWDSDNETWVAKPEMQ